MPNRRQHTAYNIQRVQRDFGYKNNLASFLAHYAFLSQATVNDDFTGPTLSTFNWTVGNGGGVSAASPVISVGAKGGQINLVTGTAGDNTASSIITSGRHFTGDSNAVIVARLNINTAVTNVKVEVHLKDNILTTAGNGPVVNVMATPTFVATDGVAWCYDFNNTGTGWQGLGVAASTGATTDTGFNQVPVFGVFETLAIELVDGVAYFHHFDANGKSNYSGSAMLLAVTKTVLLSAGVYVEARSATSKTVSVDFIKAWAYRSTATDSV